MNTVQNGKGDRPRNNCSPQWYDNYDAINWHRDEQKRQPEAPEEPTGEDGKRPFRGSRKG